jgi:DNA-binding response OmpR family regulator
MRLLVVEDNPRLSLLLTKRLGEGGFAVDAVADLCGAEAALRVTAYDLLVLDLGLPDGDGRDLLRRLRRAGNGAAVLVATARDGLDERIATLNEGADDYLVKPFSSEELLARVRVLLRRPRQALDVVLTAGNVTLDTARLAVTIGGAAVEVPPREIRVLATLLRHQGRLLPRSEVERAVYSASDEVTPNALEVAISRLRRRLEAHGATVRLASMRGLGYILSEAA